MVVTVTEVQDTRDDASLELVPSVGGDDFAADDGYDDGYDGEDPEEEDAPEDQANRVVHLEQALRTIIPPPCPFKFINCYKLCIAEGGYQSGLTLELQRDSIFLSTANSPPSSIFPIRHPFVWDFDHGFFGPCMVFLYY